MRPFGSARRQAGRTATLAVATAAILALTAPPALAATWTVVPSPNRNSFDNVLFGVDALSARQAWSVGYADTGTAPTRQPIVQRWNGTTWRIVASPTLEFGGELRDVHALSASSAWAVGFAGTANGDVPLVERWDGTHWTRVKSPAVSTLNHLLDVRAFSATNAWAVGSANVPGSLAFQTLTQRWDGTGWQVVPSPNPAPWENHLTGVDGTGPADVWAVGHTRNGPDGVEQPLIAHFNGQVWQTVATPPVGSTTLQDVVALSATDVWAVGWTFSLQVFNQVPYALHWDGQRWRSVAPPALPGARFYGVTALGPNRVYAVGESAGPGRIRPLVMRWNGAAWTAESTPAPGTVARLFDADAAGPSTIWGVGDRSGTTNRQTFTVGTSNG